MLKIFFYILVLSLSTLPSAHAGKWLDGHSMPILTIINKPFIPDTTGAVVINGYNLDGIPSPDTDIFSINITVPNGVGSFMLKPENFNHNGNFYVGELSQIKNGIKYAMNYYIRIDGLSGTLVKDSVIYRKAGEKMKFFGVYTPNRNINNSEYPWGTYAGNIGITYFSR